MATLSIALNDSLAPRVKHRRSRNAPRVFMLGLILSALTIGGAYADVSHNDALKLRNKGEIISLATLLDTLETRYPGAQILEVELERESGRYFYEIELINQTGEVRELIIDAASGELLHDERDD